MPDVSLECASNVLHFRLCRDSCTALCDLLLYLSSQRDLAPPPQRQHSAPVAAADTRGSKSSIKASHPAEGEGVGETTDIGDLISDAMEDASPTSAQRGVAQGGHTHFLPSPPTGMRAVRVSGGDALLMEFDSDSEGERDHGQPSPAPPGTAAPSLARRKMMDSLFSDSDEDDFCIVTTPTSTRVVSHNLTVELANKYC